MWGILGARKYKYSRIGYLRINFLNLSIPIPICRIFDLHENKIEYYINRIGRVIKVKMLSDDKNKNISIKLK